jgi:hypothetical protein
MTQLDHHYGQHYTGFSQCSVHGTKHDKSLIKSNNMFGMIGLLEEGEDV